jgi:phage-related protein
MPAMDQWNSRADCLISLYGYNIQMGKQLVKPLEWVGSSKRDLLAMPEPVTDVVGYALHLAQTGFRHAQAKVLKGFGSAGVMEVVEDDDGSTYRAVYTVRFANAVYVLHCFQKKSHKGIETPKHEMELVRARLKLARLHSEGVGK